MALETQYDASLPGEMPSGRDAGPGQDSRAAYGPRQMLRHIGLSSTAACVSMGSALVAQLAIAYRFGTSGPVDAYGLALPIIAYLPGIYSTVVADPLVPVWTRESDRGRTGLLAFVSRWTAGAGLMLAIGLMAVAPWVIRAMAPALAGTELASAVLLLRAMAAAPLLLALVGLLGTVLALQRSFVGQRLAAGAQPLVLATVVLLWPHTTVLPLAIGTVMGAAVNVCILVALIDRRALRRPLAPPPASALRDLRIQAQYLLVGACVSGFTVFFDRHAASQLAAGTVAALGYAERMHSSIVALLLLPLATVLFPYLAESSDDHARFRRALRFCWRLTSGVFVPSAVFVALMAYPAVVLLFARGRFGETEVRQVVPLVTAHMFLLPLYALTIVTVKAVLSVRLAALTGVTAFVIFCLKATLNPWVAVRFGAPGLVWLTAACYAINLVVLLLVLLHRTGSWRLLPALTFDAMRILASVSLAGFVIAVTVGLPLHRPGVWAAFRTLLISGLAFTAIYVAGAVVSGLIPAAELRAVVAKLNPWKHSEAA